MLPSKSVYIVGAGASHEVGLPVGDTLKKGIATKLAFSLNGFRSFEGQGDSAIFNVLKMNYSDELATYIDTCKQIRSGIVLAESIDDYIDSHKHDETIAKCGKIAIARSILEAESNSKLNFSRNNIYNTINFDSVEDTWYTSFFRLLKKGVSKESVATLFENVTIISFNYDRCIEHYLVHAVAKFYELSITESADLVKRLTIYHPYGSVGPYFSTNNEKIEFGAEGLPQLDKLLLDLKTYTENVSDTEKLEQIRNEIADAKVLVFLGNAYHENNMRLLISEGLSHTHIQPKKVFATRFGISDADLSSVREFIALISGYKSQASLNDMNSRDKFKENINFSNTCNDLFDEYRLSLRS